MPKAKCYTCKYRGKVSGSAHSLCRHPQVVGEDGLTAVALSAGLLAYQLGEITLDQLKGGWAKILGVSGTDHGIHKGWFWWPVNFDPVWLVDCDGHTPTD